MLGFISILCLVVGALYATLAQARAKEREQIEAALHYQARLSERLAVAEAGIENVASNLARSSQEGREDLKGVKDDLQGIRGDMTDLTVLIKSWMRDTERRRDAAER